MKLIHWDAKYETGIETVDQQHRHLFELINRLFEAVHKSTEGMMDEILKELVDYTVYHFGTEEKYFDETGYPESEAHKKEHALFVGKVMTFKRDLDEKKATISVSLLSFLWDWLNNHILTEDMKFGPYLKSKGI